MMTTSGVKWVYFFYFLVYSISRTDQALSLFTDGIESVLEWKQLEFKYPSENYRKRDIESEVFTPGVPAIIDVDVAFADDEKKKTIFVTIPRFQLGIPVTFGKVTKEVLNGNHVIEPYPNWSWHRNPTKCSKERLVSVYRTQIDSCGRLWVLDSGNYVDKLSCPPQIIAFDLNRNDQVVHKYEIPQEVLQSNSLPVTIMVDVNDGCKETFVYAADVQGNALIVYDVSKNMSWKIQDKSMYPDPNWGTFHIMGESFELMDGILGMALTTHQNPRKLFFHALSSNTEHVVQTSDIRTRERFTDNPNSSPEIFHTYKGRRKSQSPAEAIDKDGILYFGDVNKVTLNCWDTSSAKYGPRNFGTLSTNKTILQFTSGMKVVNTSNKTQDLYVVTSRFQKVILGTINSKETNFRILRLKLNRLTKRRCKKFKLM